MTISRVKRLLKRAIARLFTRNSAVILGYHGVSDEPLSFQNWIQIPKNLFAQHLEYLARNYQCVSLSQLITAITRGGGFQHRLCITSDDGYANLYTNVFPLIKNYNIPLTVFLPAAYVDTDSLLWFDKIYCTILSSKKTAFEFMNQKFNVRSPYEMEYAYRSIVNSCKILNSDGIEQTIHDIANQLKVDTTALKANGDFKHFRILSWSEIKEMSRSGLVEFGSHSTTHSILSRLSNDESYREIAESKKILQPHLRSISLFSYPNGTLTDFSNTHIHFLKSLGFSGAVTTIHARVKTSSDVFQLPRFLIGNTCNVNDLEYMLTVLS